MESRRKWHICKHKFILCLFILALLAVRNRQIKTYKKVNVKISTYH